MCLIVVIERTRSVRAERAGCGGYLSALPLLRWHGLRLFSSPTPFDRLPFKFGSGVRDPNVTSLQDGAGKVVRWESRVVKWEHSYRCIKVSKCPFCCFLRHAKCRCEGPGAIAGRIVFALRVQMRDFPSSRLLSLPVNRGFSCLMPTPREPVLPAWQDVVASGCLAKPAMLLLALQAPRTTRCILSE